MELRHLRYFVAVAEELHVTRAAERLHIAQPPLSRQIQALEEELGVALFDRSSRGDRGGRRLALTDAGQAFLDKARQILRSVESAAVDAQRAARGETGTLAVGFYEQIAYTLLPPILRRFQERFPQVDIQLRWFPNLEQVEALRRGDSDIAFVRPVSPLDGLCHQPLLSEPFVLALPANHRFAQRKRVPLAACAGERIVNYARRLAPDYHDAILKMCALAGFAPDVALEVGQVYTALGLVSSGIGVTFVPASVQRLRFENVVYRPLARAKARSGISLVWQRPDASPILSAFVEIARETAARKEDA
ncbi:MAG: LysR substrate-binding domain-containing protein, partial [Burkholderiaceae bacterium]